MSLLFSIPAYAQYVSGVGVGSGSGGAGATNPNFSIQGPATTSGALDITSLNLSTQAQINSLGAWCYTGTGFSGGQVTGNLSPLNCSITSRSSTSVTVTFASSSNVLVILNSNGGSGPAGAPGNTGAAGAAATVAVGTVTTGSPGSPASVVNGGTAGAAVFNVTVPRGDVGPQGAQGPAGTNGTNGTNGVNVAVTSSTSDPVGSCSSPFPCFHANTAADRLFYSSDGSWSEVPQYGRGTTVPGACTIPGQIWVKSDTGALYGCNGSTFAPAGSGAALGDPAANGLVVRTASNTTTARTLAGTANEVTVTNGDGVAGAPTIALAATLDFTAKSSTKPSKSGASLPGTCTASETFILTSAPAASQLYVCTATNTWTAQGGAGGGNVSAAATFGAANRIVTAADTSRGVQDTTCTVSSGNLACPGTISGASTGAGVEGTPIANASVTSPPTAGDWRTFWDASNGDFLSDKKSDGTVRRYVTTNGVQTLTGKSIDAAQLTGTVAAARLGTGTADSTTVLRGDQTWGPSGSGLSITSAGSFYWLTTGGIVGTKAVNFVNVNAAGSTNGVAYVAQFALKDTVKLGKRYVQIYGSGAADGLAIAVYADSSGAPGAKLAEFTVTDTHSASTSANYVTWNAAVTLTPGMYWLGWAVADNGTYTLFPYSDADTRIGDVLNAVGKAGSCFNPTTGSGTTITMPTTCGTVTPRVITPPLVFVGN